MNDYFEKTCPNCGQRLRFPKDVGGIVMACSTCGHKFSSDFKLGGVRKKAPRGPLILLFELPSTILQQIVRFFTPK